MKCLTCNKTCRSSFKICKGCNSAEHTTCNLKKSRIPDGGNFVDLCSACKVNRAGSIFKLQSAVYANKDVPTAMLSHAVQTENALAYLFARVADLEKRLGLNDESQKTLSLAPTIAVQERFKSNPTVSDSSGTE